MVLLLFLAALLSVVGYGYSLNQFLKIPIALSYAVAIAMKVLVLFISGILDVLPFVVYILFVLGLLLLTCSVLRFRDLSPFYHPGTLFMMVCLLVHVFILHDAKLLFFDDFSHWGLMVKEMVAYGDFLMRNPLLLIGITLRQWHFLYFLLLQLQVFQKQ
ncbi:hypothetical protein [Geomicrobium sp. JCM 19038]|uniref:hypothetical protein n=1 Tax=Geomicrobium sp. JCM 19038 TaxID=1460635 RepID=UPI0005AB42E3|nr:hypothetical protein [Geomicrobium sp. JCM 19038]